MIFAIVLLTNMDWSFQNERCTARVLICGCQADMQQVQHSELMCVQENLLKKLTTVALCSSNNIELINFPLWIALMIKNIIFLYLKTDPTDQSSIGFDKTILTPTMYQVMWAWEPSKPEWSTLSNVEHSFRHNYDVRHVAFDFLSSFSW